MSCAGRVRPIAGDGGAVVQVTTTVESEADAERLATLLLDDRLAACVQTVGPVRSRYWWKGAQETATEFVLVVKTTAAAAGDVVRAITAAHPYDVPEVLVSPVINGHQPYLDWVASEVRLS